jgi:O-antigen ligase
MNFLGIALAPKSTARFLALMLVAWQPLVSGARLPSILLALLGIWMLFHKYIDFSSEAAKRLGIISLLLLIPMLISIPGSFNPIGSVEVAVVLMLFYVAGLAMMQGFSSKTDHAWLQRWLTIVLLAWLADGYIQYLFGRDILGIPLGENARIFGPFRGNLHFGLFITVLMPIMLWRMAKARPLWAIACMALIGFVAGMSARTNMLFFLLASATLVPHFGWRHRALMALGLIAALTATTLLSPAISERFKPLADLGQQTDTSLFQQVDRILSGRMIIWETAVEMVKDRPLTGVGTSAFAEAYDHYATRPEDPFRSGGSYPGGVYHAHQMYVSITAESGLIGLAALIAAVALCIAWFFRAPAERRAQASPYAASLAVIAFPVQSQPVLYTIWWFPIVLLLLCGMLAAIDKNPS